MNKEHQKYNVEELRKAYYVLQSITEEIESGKLTEEEIKKEGRGLLGDKDEALTAIELVGHLLEVYGA